MNVTAGKVDLTKWFDSIDLAVGAIGDWEEFETRFAHPSRGWRATTKTFGPIGPEAFV